jgi:hypothetical protein
LVAGGPTREKQGQELGTARTTSGPRSGNITINFPTHPFLASPHNTPTLYIDFSFSLLLLLLLLPPP